MGIKKGRASALHSFAGQHGTGKKEGSESKYFCTGMYRIIVVGGSWNTFLSFCTTIILLYYNVT